MQCWWPGQVLDGHSVLTLPYVSTVALSLFPGTGEGTKRCAGETPWQSPLTSLQYVLEDKPSASETTPLPPGHPISFQVRGTGGSTLKMPQGVGKEALASRAEDCSSLAEGIPERRR